MVVAAKLLKVIVDFRQGVGQEVQRDLRAGRLRADAERDEDDAPLRVLLLHPREPVDQQGGFAAPGGGDEQPERPRSGGEEGVELRKLGSAPPEDGTVVLTHVLHPSPKDDGHGAQHRLIDGHDDLRPVATCDAGSSDTTGDGDVTPAVCRFREIEWCQRFLARKA